MSMNCESDACCVCDAFVSDGYCVDDWMKKNTMSWMNIWSAKKKSKNLNENKISLNNCENVWIHCWTKSEIGGDDARDPLQAYDANKRPEFWKHGGSRDFPGTLGEHRSAGDSGGERDGAARQPAER